MSRSTARSGLCVVLAAALGTAFAAGVADFPFVPDESFAGPMTLGGRTWSYAGTGYAMSIQHLTDEERGAYLKHVTGLAIDPFLAPPTAETRYLSFLVQLENRSDAQMAFNPLDCWLSTNDREVSYPVGLDDLATTYRQLESELPAAYENVRPALLEQRSTLEPGDSVAGLLIYHAFRPKTKRFQVDLQVVLASGGVIKATAPYRRSKN